jgi:transcription antitermination factor NusG
MSKYLFSEKSLERIEKEDKKNIARFEIGEKVRVIMCNDFFSNKVVTITKIINDPISPSYNILEDNGENIWAEDIFIRLPKEAEENMPKFEVEEDALLRCSRKVSYDERARARAEYELYRMCKLKEDKKSMTGFKIGEKVRFVRRGYAGCGRIVTISEIDNTILIHHTLYKFKEDESSWWYENAFEKLKEEKKMIDAEDCVWDRHVFAKEYKSQWTGCEKMKFRGKGKFHNKAVIIVDTYFVNGTPTKYRFDGGEGKWYDAKWFQALPPHPKKMLDDLGIEKVILSEKRGKAVTYVELKDGRSGKATQDIKDTPDPYVGIAIATLSAMTGSKVNFRNMVDFLVKKGQYIRK